MHKLGELIYREDQGLCYITEIRPPDDSNIILYIADLVYPSGGIARIGLTEDAVQSGKKDLLERMNREDAGHKRNKGRSISI